MLSLSKLKTSTLAWNIFRQVWWVANSTNSDEAREMARKSTKEIYENLFADLWIKVSINFSNDSSKDFPKEFEALQRYIKTWELSENIPLLFLWNHQAFWLEAIWAYDIFPTNGRILLKDTLTKIPYFWNWIKALDPIIFDRKLWLTKENTKKRNEEIRDTVLSWRSVLIYPEWTRSRNWDLGDLYPALYSTAVKTIKESLDIPNKVAAIITSNTNNTFPDTLEKSLFFWSNAKKLDIKFTIDFIDLTTFENMKEINEAVEGILSDNLMYV